MQEPITQGTEPLVLHIRISGRWVPVLSALSVFALLPALTASAPLEAGAPQHLAAPSRLQEARALGSAAAETVTVSAAQLTAATLLGGGTIGFPTIALNPASAVPVAAGSPFVKKAGFIMPVTGPVMSLFGPRVHPVLGVPMFHTGIDLGAACATPIRAAADGTVTYAGVSSSWGQRIIIEHDSALKTGYAHLSKSFARQGDVVKQGQVIGLVGTTGWSTGCHLHFDVILNDRYVDPRPYLGLGPASPASIPYSSTPHSVSDGRGSTYTVPDGDVPIPTTSSSPTPTSTSTTPGSTTSTTPSPTGSSTPTPSTTTTTPTTEPTTGTPTTTDPTTTDPTTTEPTTTEPTTSEPTTSEPTTSTTEPAPEPTSEPAPEPTSEPAPEPTSEPAPEPTSEATSTSTTSATSTSEPATTTAEETAAATTTSSP